MTTPGQRRLGIGGHHAPHHGAKDEWLTPPELVASLGPFDLDPCSPIDRPWPTAAHHLTLDDDGLTADWTPYGIVWCNPPYGPDTWQWLDRVAAHPPGGICLVFARTETVGFVRSVWRTASALLFIAGRLHFHHVTGERAHANSGAPSVLVGYGAVAEERLSRAVVDATVAGTFVNRWNATAGTSRAANADPFPVPRASLRPRKPEIS